MSTPNSTSTVILIISLTILVSNPNAALYIKLLLYLTLFCVCKNILISRSKSGVYSEDNHENI